MKRINSKKKTIICVILALAAVFALALTSCSDEDVRGVAGAYINDAGELVLTYTDGTFETLGVVVGEDGTDGKDGADGKDGKDGADGASGSSSDIVKTTAKALRSAVSIICKFTKNGEEFTSAGAGVIYKLDREEGDAFIITNYHVVFDVHSDTGVSEDIDLYLYGAEYADFVIDATYVGGSMNYDIAVLRVEDCERLKNSTVMAAEICDSDTVYVGDVAIAVGNPLGEGTSATSGIISVDSESLTMEAADEKTEVTFRVMRIDTAVNSGNSGGGVYNEKGELIGIVNAKSVRSGVDNIGYAIPTNVAIAIVDNIIYYCYENEEYDVKTAQRALLGITVIIDETSAVYNSENGKVDIVETLRVNDEVLPGTLAHGRIQKDDILLRAALNDGEMLELTRQHHLIDLMLHAKVGDTVQIIVLRDGNEIFYEFEITKDCLKAS